MMNFKAQLKVLGTALFLSAGDSFATDWNVEDTSLPFTAKTITATEGTWMSVDVSPDGKTLVFDMLGDIYSMPATGGNATLILGGPAMEKIPRFSPDGSKILYISDKSGSYNVWTAQPDGTDAKPVTVETVDALAGPTWSADGQYVIASLLSAQYTDLHTSSLQLYHTDGGVGQEVVASPGPYQNVQEPQFSPDGRYLYFTERISKPHASIVYVNANETNFAIMRRDMVTGETKQLIGGFGGALTPQVSPSGRYIAFVRRVKTKTVLFIYDTETNQQRPVYDDLSRDLQAESIPQGTFYPQYGWFPDDRHIAIWAKGKIYKIDSRNGAAKNIPFVATAEHKITKVPRFSANLTPDTVRAKSVRQITASPKNGMTIFHALGHLWKQGHDEDSAVRLTKGKGLEFEPSLSTGAEFAVYVEWTDEGGSRLQIAPVSGGAPKTLFETRFILREPAFSPDGRKIAFRVEAGNKCMGGYGADAGIFILETVSGKVRKLINSGEAPQFSPSGDRLYYNEISYSYGSQTTTIESVDLNGGDKRVHAKAYGSDIVEVRISPDLERIAFKDSKQYYVMPFVETGAPQTLTGSMAYKLTDLGGYNLKWSADGSHLYWTLGQELHSVDVTTGQSAHKIGNVVAEVKADKPKGLIAFTGARIITMKGQEVIENGTLLVRDNRIVAVGAASDVDIPNEAQLVEVKGKTMMPGLVNMHGHIDSCYYSSVGLMPEKQPSHYASLAFGTTTNFDPYATELPSYTMSEMRNAGLMVGPRMISVGHVAYGRAGKGDPVYEPIFSYEDARKFMQRKTLLGGTIIKSYRQPMRSQRQMLIKAAHELGIMVTIEGESHFYNNITAIIDGHTALEHNFPVATLHDDLIQLLAAGDTANTPTLITLFGEMMGENYVYERTRAWEDPRVDSFIPEVTSGYSALGTPYAAPLYARNMTTLHVADELWDVGFRSVAKSLKKAADLGTRVNIGSHAQIQGLAMHWEMWLMSEGGMGNHQVLKAATLNGAETIGLDTQIGSLEVGKLADIIVLDENPLDDIHNSVTVSKTIVNGRVYDSYSMDEVIRRSKPRTRFYWQPDARYGIDWQKSSASQ